MSRIGECPPCQMGDHKHHYKSVHPAPEGGFGGTICTCTGECRERSSEENARRVLGPALFEASRRGLLSVGADPAQRKDVVTHPRDDQGRWTTPGRRHLDPPASTVEKALAFALGLAVLGAAVLAVFF